MPSVSLRPLVDFDQAFVSVLLLTAAVPYAAPLRKLSPRKVTMPSSSVYLRQVEVYLVIAFVLLDDLAVNHDRRAGNESLRLCSVNGMRLKVRQSHRRRRRLGVGVGVGCTVTAGLSAVSSSALFAAMPRITTMTSTARATNITMPTTVLAVILFSSISLSTLFYYYSVK